MFLCWFDWHPLTEIHLFRYNLADNNTLNCKSWKILLNIPTYFGAAHLVHMGITFQIIWPVWVVNFLHLLNVTLEVWGVQKKKGAVRKVTIRNLIETKICLGFGLKCTWQPSLQMSTSPLTTQPQTSVFPVALKSPRLTQHRKL